MKNEDTLSLLARVGKLIDQTDPWTPDKCVYAITTVEARKGRSAFYELWKRFGEGRCRQCVPREMPADQIPAPPTDVE